MGGDGERSSSQASRSCLSRSARLLSTRCRKSIGGSVSDNLYIYIQDRNQCAVTEAHKSVIGAVFTSDGLVSRPDFMSLGLVSVSRFKGLALTRDYSNETTRLEGKKKKNEWSGLGLG